MQFEDEVIPETDPETAWALVSGPEVLVSCVPGAEEVERLTESRYRGTMKRGIAGINVSLSGELEMTELDPPRYVRADASIHARQLREGHRLLDEEIAEAVESTDNPPLDVDFGIDATKPVATQWAKRPESPGDWGSIDLDEYVADGGE